ncbi:hypothetical protein TrRE_jg5870 [Triparma retinervis]|uniref:Uncharacterized protein n=1 Tax=Triparma retinervis TaxID=2557542 RepID=A0A9W7E4F3_9STRA|nr:hypothetical protein TrRE_jg5870 [Triparma retinervis]
MGVLLASQPSFIMLLQFDKLTVSKMIASYASAPDQLSERYREFVHVPFGGGQLPADAAESTESVNDFFHYQPGYATVVTPFHGVGLQVAFAVHTTTGDSNLTVLSAQGEGSGVSLPSPFALLAIDSIGDKARDGKVAFCPVSIVGVLVERAQLIARAADHVVTYSVESLGVIPIAFLAEASEGPAPTLEELSSWKEPPLMLDLASSIWAQLRKVVVFQKDTADPQLFPARRSTVPEGAELMLRFPAHKTAFTNAVILGGCLLNPAGAPPQGPPAAQLAAAAPQVAQINQSLAIAQLSLARAKGAEYEMRLAQRTYNGELETTISQLLGPGVAQSFFFTKAFANNEMKKGKATLTFHQFLTPRLAPSMLRKAWPSVVPSFPLPARFEGGAEAGVFTADMFALPRGGSCGSASDFIDCMVPLILLSEFVFGDDNPFSVWLQSIVEAVDRTRSLPAAQTSQLNAGSFWDNLLGEILLELEAAYGETLSALVLDSEGLSPTLSTVFLTPGSSYADVYSFNVGSVGLIVASAISLLFYHDRTRASPTTYCLAAPWQLMVGPPRLTPLPPAPLSRVAGTPASPTHTSTTSTKEVLAPWGPLGTVDRTSLLTGRTLHMREATAQGQPTPSPCVKYLIEGRCHTNCRFHHLSVRDLPTDEIISAYAVPGSLAMGTVQGIQRQDAASATVLAPISTSPRCSATKCKLCKGA